MKALVLLFLSIAAVVLGADPDVGSLKSPDGKHFTGYRRIPHDDDRIWKMDFDDTKIVILSSENGVFGSIERKFLIHYGIIEQIGWSPNSRFLVVTTQNAAGHRPYLFPTFVYDSVDHCVRSVGSVTESVLDGAFKFEGDDTLIVTVRDPAHELFTDGDRKIEKIALHEQVSKMEEVKE